MDKNTKVDYGIDAPRAVRNIFIIGIILFLIGVSFRSVTLFGLHLEGGIFMVFGMIMMTESFLMVLYSKFGKRRHMRRMLKMVDWSGDETVLDVGTGRGLLMIGAAKAFGIDIWNPDYLSGNDREYALSNSFAEGVFDKVEVLNYDARDMRFPDGNFDVVLSNLCLHNIVDKAGREKACSEIHRVLKTGGVAVISDYKYVKEYKKTFKKLGCAVSRKKSYYTTTFPPLKVIRVKK